VDLAAVLYKAETVLSIVEPGCLAAERTACLLTELREECCHRAGAADPFPDMPLSPHFDRVDAPFAYDSENRLKSMNGGAVTSIYDGDGNRISKTASGVTTRYLVDDLNPTRYAQVIEEVVNGAVQREYAYGLQRISENQIVNGTWTPSFYGYDGMGNVRS
jgi:hypothetical protein